MLGPLLVKGANGPVTIASAKQRALLATLLLEAPHKVVRTDRLIDELWGERPPATAGKALQVHVSQLRRALGAEQPIVTRPGGYAIHIDRVALDVHRFDTLLAKARRLRTEGDLDGALDALQDGLGLWRGPALADVTLLGPGASEAGRLEGLCAIAQEERLELELARGGGAALVPELEALIVADPYREHIYAMLMLALYRAGRQADALETYRRARHVLIEELGLEPGPELTGLEAAILSQDPALELPATVSRSLIAPASSQPSADGSEAAIPLAAASLVGREDELQEARRLVHQPEVRLVTLTGAGGIGKTRLALELAGRLGERTHLVELASVVDPQRVVPAIAAALGAEDGSEEALVGALEREPAVLFLDNFEQVIAAAPVVSSLLGAVPSLTIVVTSRAPLHVAGEHELPVPPLSGEAAVELFVSRAREQDPRFAADAEEIACIATICERLEGLPLAIELAAARIRVLTAAEILDRIGERLDLLTAGRRDAPERHRTLRATIAWSYDLLDDEQRRLFAQLAVFHSGWTLEACEALAGVPVLDALAALIEHGLVMRDGQRFRMLETVRQYAAERLEESGEASTARLAHARWCLELAEAAEQQLEGPAQAEWFARLEAERDNLRGASDWAVANGEPEITMRLDGALWRFWLVRGAAAGARGALGQALATGEGEPTLRAKALNAAGVLAGEVGNIAAARESFEKARELAAQLGDRRQIARTLMNLGVIALYTADYPAALSRYGEAGEIWQELGDVRGQSVMCQNLAIVHELMGQWREATPLLEQSIEQARAAGDGIHLAQTLIELAKHLVAHRLNDPRISDLLREGLELARDLRVQPRMIEGLEVLAAFSARRGAPLNSAELIGAAEAERERTGTERKADELPVFEPTVRKLEQALGRKDYERAYLRGYGRSLEVAVAVALKTLEPGRTRQTAPRRGLRLIPENEALAGGQGARNT